MSTCTIAPISGFQSTNLNNRIDSFNRLGDRIIRSLGYPTINVEIHRDQLFENISIATEYFTKFAGYTREYLVFDSNLYRKNYGIKLDTLFSLNATDVKESNFLETRSITNPTFTKYTDLSSTRNYLCLTAIDGTLFQSIPSLSGTFLSGGISRNEIIPAPLYQEFISVEKSSEFATIGNAVLGLTFEIGSSNTVLLTGFFQAPVPHDVTLLGEVRNDANHYSMEMVNSFDYDLMDYRKVIDVKNFTEGSTTGINTLFTIEQTLAQQTYFSYAMGNYGFDLVSWYTLKNWLETREKLLAIERTFDFDPRTQILRMYPQPGSANNTVRFYGVLDCYVERPIRDVIKELWVYQYSLALTKIVVGRIRGKYQGTGLFGGGQLNDGLLQEGLQEKADLEQQLYEGTPGQGDADPPLFFVG